LAEIRKIYDYYHHMDQQANHAEVIPDRLVDKFAIAGTVTEWRGQIERIHRTGIRRIAIIPYGLPLGGREETVRRFVKTIR
jgi:5,10-methylenetetrahydromethanopterin reductase